jgi:hypothetical protein
MTMNNDIIVVRRLVACPHRHCGGVAHRILVVMSRHRLLSSSPHACNILPSSGSCATSLTAMWHLDTLCEPVLQGEGVVNLPGLAERNRQ